ncbi:hypothetical protein [Acinetobacter soli]|uniref:hypothetical protein n=1 Tax=Acinetobacter soli TaxID=487316 RepID=UPI00123130C6|nr:hypothetical protein [Acinetobacter soli]
MSNEKEIENEIQAEQIICGNSYVDHYSLVQQGEFLLKVIEGPVSKEVSSLAENKLSEILNKF